MSIFVNAPVWAAQRPTTPEEGKPPRRGAPRGRPSSKPNQSTGDPATLWTPEAPDETPEAPAKTPLPKK